MRIAGETLQDGNSWILKKKDGGKRYGGKRENQD